MGRSLTLCLVVGFALLFGVVEARAVCIDNDSDGFGSPGDVSCPNGSLTDCNDANGSIYPFAPEILCNSVDENCNGLADDDRNMDGDPVSLCNGDCNDNNASIYPGAADILCNGVDDNCNGMGDEDRNFDGDPVSLCAGDCNDNNATIYPGATEILCNLVDENCTGNGDDDVDLDGDLWTFCAGDCNDNNASINPDVTEVCTDGIDNNCDDSLDCGDFDCFFHPACDPTDSDGDGVTDYYDACPATPAGTAVDGNGRPIGDFDLDCDTDLIDYAIFLTGYTGPL